MNEVFKNFMEKITVPERQEGPSIDSAQDVINRLQETHVGGNALSREQRNEAREVVLTLEKLQKDIEGQPEAVKVLAEIQVALTLLRSMLGIS